MSALEAMTVSIVNLSSTFPVPPKSALQPRCVALLLAASALLPACASRPRADTVDAQTPVAADNSGTTVLAANPAAPTAPPSLADEVKTQGTREAASLSRTLGVRIEPLDNAVSPAWFAAAANDPARAAGSSTGATLHKAVDGAVSRAGQQIQSRGGDPRNLRVEQAAWKRLPMGTFIAWAALGDGSNMSQAAPAIDLPPTQVAAFTAPAEPTLPTLAKPRVAISTLPSEVVENFARVPEDQHSPPTAPTVASASPGNAPAAQSADGPRVVAAPDRAPAVTPIAQGSPAVVVAPIGNSQPAKPPLIIPDYGSQDPSRPAWFMLKPVESNDRITVGVIAEGENTRDCARLALRSGKDQLQTLVGREPQDLVTQRSSVVKLPDGRVRMYALITCTGTFKPAAQEPTPPATAPSP